MGSSLVCTSASSAAVSSVEEHSSNSYGSASTTSKRRKHRRPWKKNSLVHPAPPRISTSSWTQPEKEAGLGESTIRGEPADLFGSFRSRRSLRVFSKRSNTETKLDCLVEACNNGTHHQQQLSLDTQLIQKYTIKRVIGKGNFSRVLEAEDKLSHVRYAMKVMEKSILTSTPWDRELEVLKRVHHPNVIHLHEAYSTGAKLYLVLELASGGDLLTKLQSVGHFEEDRARTLLAMILSALEYLHRHGVTHRDLKLENCLFKTKDANSIILLSDFGLANLQPVEECKREAMQTTCGTEDYISPEMLNGDLYTDRIDMWAFGVITYALLSGSMPFRDESRAKMYRNIKDGYYSLSNEVWQLVSSEAIDFLSKLLCVNPEQRSTAVAARQHNWISQNCAY